MERNQVGQLHSTNQFNISSVLNQFVKLSMAFARKLRLAMYFYRKRKENPVNDEAGKGIESVFGSEDEPWKPKSAFDPDPGDSDSLEEFLNEVQSRTFDPRKRKKLVDNLTPGERQALWELSSWKKDPKNPRYIRIQDKGSRFVVDWRNRYVNKTLQYVQNTSTFSSNDEDPSLENHKRVGKWCKKWQDGDVLSEEITDWVVMNKYKPANLYGNIKTHLEGWPYRFIMSSKGTATENLARWIEYHLKPFAQFHQDYIRDTKSFLLYPIVSESI